MADGIDGQAEEYRHRLEHHIQAEIDADVQRHRERLQSSYAKGIDQWVDDFRHRLEVDQRD